MKKLKKPTSINPFFFTFFLFFKKSFCLDSSYEACVPKHCGDVQNISYPFFIKGLQEPFCGYPGFELFCNNNSSLILQIPENDFIVRNIQYQNRSVRLLKAAILSTQRESCPLAIRNTTLDPNRFPIDNASTSELVLLSNCSDKLPANLERYRIRSCQKSTELIMLANDTNLGNGTKFCGRGGGIVVTPVELGGGEGRSVVVDGGNYAEVMERGFVVRWLAGDCDVCKKSGGRCGFDRTVFQFRCFCPDRPHMGSCKPGKNFLFLVSI